jgi:endonuclease/exonuclease/phosphatase family metal-dependent hydrolase
MPAVFASLPELPVVWLGDFNQRFPAMRGPDDARAAMSAACEKWVLATAGELDSKGNHVIDHIAYRGGLRHLAVSVTPMVTLEGVRLSDHSGLLAVLDRLEAVSVR